jgi:hypothetical protein
VIQSRAMPFKSPKQRKFMYANHPDIAKRWSAEEKKHKTKKVKRKKNR